MAAIIFFLSILRLDLLSFRFLAEVTKPPRNITSKKWCTFSPAGASCSMWCQAGTPRPAPSRAQARAAARARPATGRAGKARCPCPAALVAARSCLRPIRRSAHRSAPTGQAAGCAGRPPARGWRAAGSARGRRRCAAPRAPRCPAARAPECGNVAGWQVMAGPNAPSHALQGGHRWGVNWDLKVVPRLRRPPSGP